jgi:hypothetical protein
MPIDTLNASATCHCEAEAIKAMSGGAVKAGPRQSKEIPREHNPKKGSGVFKANSLENGYGLLTGIKPCSWGLGSWRN